MIRLLTLCACLMVASPAFAQKHKKAKARTIKVSTPISLDSIERHYSEYNFDGAKRDLQLLERSASSADERAVSLYRARIERAERMLEHTDLLPLVEKHQVRWSELNALLHEKSPFLSQYIHIEGDSLAYSAYTFRVRLGGLKFDLMRQAKKGLVRRDYPEGAPMEEVVLGSNVSSVDGMENFPFLLSDGIRLIFARKSEGGLGGYDLYLSRYSLERKEYLEPTLLPMPFNSPSNDYLLAYDESNHRSYLLSDRDCPAGFVVLYIFSGLPEALSGLKAETEDDAPEIANLKARALLRIDVQNNQDNNDN